MAKKIFGSIALQDQQSVLFFDLDNSNSVALKAPAVVASNLTFTLPAADGTSGQVLQTNASGVLSFVTKVSGPGSATDNTVARFDGTTGALIQGSSVVIDDSNNVTGVVALTASGTVTADTVLAKTALQIEDPGAGTNAVSIAAPSGLASSYSLTLPVDDGTSGQVLQTDGSGVLSWYSVPAATVTKYKTNWVTADTATFAITHSLGTTDVMVQVFDVSTGDTIEIDSVTRTDANTVTVVASSAPPATNWRVLILAL